MELRIYFIPEMKVLIRDIQFPDSLDNLSKLSELRDVKEGDILLLARHAYEKTQDGWQEVNITKVQALTVQRIELTKITKKAKDIKTSMPCPEAKVASEIEMITEGTTLATMGSIEGIEENEDEIIEDF